MAEQTLQALESQLAGLSHAELASLVIELVEDGRVAVPLGEELYRRLNQPTPTTEWLWYRTAQTVPAARHGSAA